MKPSFKRQLLIALIAIAGVSLAPSIADAQDQSGCFMVDDNGRVLDLGGLCPGESSGVREARIKRRESGIPVIDVTFNGRQTFEMLLDTGASATAITPQMAQALGVVAEGTARMETAGGTIQTPLGRVNSVAAGGIVSNNVIVSINNFLPLGLLGQDVFGAYDVVIRQHVVEFHPR